MAHPLSPASDLPRAPGLPSPASLDQMLEAMAGDRSLHLGGEPSDEADLRRVEVRLHLPLPAAFRTFLTRLGGGVFYRRHEIFGAQRVMIHDIELVPDLLSVRSRWPDLPAHLLPIHREGEHVHVLDLESGAVLPLPAGPGYPDFQSFLARVVVPPGA